MNAPDVGLPQGLASTGEPPPDDCADWRAVLAARHGRGPVPEGTALATLYGPLCAPRRTSCAFAHLAQSLDGRIATAGGMSRWLSGAEDLLHTHRMRALCDAVLVGSQTVLHDDPQLTVRRCTGTSPVRVVVDPERRLDATQRVFRDGAAPTLLLVAEDRAGEGPDPGLAELVPIARIAGQLDPLEIRRVLARRGLTRLFVEGGGSTVSRFLAAGALDRLQITVAPVILGSGRPGLVLPEISDLAKSLRPRTRRFDFGDDTLIECIFDD
ncbi:MAG: RibD family protein [Burkholderiales bacterium]|jgi:riboflavin-specific deaminase-like protein